MLTVNGNEHLANADVHEYDNLKVVVEAPDSRTVKVTVYKDDDPEPISSELYGHA